LPAAIVAVFGLEKNFLLTVFAEEPSLLLLKFLSRWLSQLQFLS
jgi:hypothetical protein